MTGNMELATQYLGVTPPISTAMPTDAETSATTALLEELRRQNTFEAAEDTEKRFVVSFTSRLSLF